jgi:hypothetical protein
LTTVATMHLSFFILNSSVLVLHCYCKTIVVLTPSARQSRDWVPTAQTWW